MHALLSLLLLACQLPASAGPPADGDLPQAAPPLAKGQAEAIFAAGCFWCAESDFEKLPGVIDAVSGYAGGHVDHPTYKVVGTGATGHTEAIRVIYDPKKVSYGALLHHYWRHVDPFDGDGQFCDQGSQYRPALFPVDEAQRAAATKSKAEIEHLLGKPVAVKLEEPGTFWVAETYHQDFYKKNPSHYQRYRQGCGRDARVAAIWAEVEAKHP
ncbi:MAG: peptide-methionine (S)-S-oxide reductase MsrA [Alphaproteobacteria bacterium]|nr:peptide-methionine (S)-S-oxide reductase MsrA [Alphaproteobacteria bacterium]